jgi:hypothetical protein
MLLLSLLFSTSMQFWWPVLDATKPYQLDQCNLAGGGLDDGGEAVMCALVGGVLAGQKVKRRVLLAERAGARRGLGLVNRWLLQI